MVAGDVGVAVQAAGAVRVPVVVLQHTRGVRSERQEGDAEPEYAKACEKSEGMGVRVVCRYVCMVGMWLLPLTRHI